MGLGFLLWNFQGVTQICRISRSRSFFSPEFLGVKCRSKISRGAFQKSISSTPPPLFGFFLEQPIYSSNLTFLSSSVTSVRSLHSLHQFLFLSNFLFSFLILPTVIQIFFFSVSLKPSLNFQVASQLATLKFLIKSEGAQVDVSRRTIGTIKLEYNTNLYSKDIGKAILFFLYPRHLAWSFPIPT